MLYNRLNDEFASQETVYEVGLTFPGNFGCYSSTQHSIIAGSCTFLQFKQTLFNILLIRYISTFTNTS